MQPVLLLGLWAIVAYVLYLGISHVATKRRQAKKARTLGCLPTPLGNQRDPFGIGTVREMLTADREMRLPDWSRERFDGVSKRLGRPVTTMRNVIAFEESFFTIDPLNVQTLLAKGFKDFYFGPSRNGNFEPLLGHGIFASDGKDWEASRALLRPQFARDQVSDLVLEETHVQNMLKALPIKADGWTDLTDIQVLFFRLTLDSATEFLFSESVDSQINNLPGHKKDLDIPIERDERHFALAFDAAQRGLARANRLGSNYAWAHTADFKKQCRDVHVFVDYFVQMALSKAAREKTQSAEEKKDKKYVFLDALAAQTTDPITLRDQLLNILLAGRDTTASLLSWLFRLLAQHPAVFTKLRAAILADFGTWESCDPGTITFSGLKNCTYLQYTLNETLRLYPVVPLNSRRSAVDTTLPRGGGPDGQSPVFIPAEKEVVYSVYVQHRRKDIWGEDADAFRPERWEGRRVGWEYLPFNGGPRICIGQQFALTEAGYVVVRLLQRFEAIEGVGMEGRERNNLSLTSCPGDGANVRLREAKA